MKLVFRCDASLVIGNGHVMRCLTLAQALRAQGASCRFVSRADAGHLLEAVGAQGFEALALPASTPGLDPDDPAADARQTLAALDGSVADWLVMDHYALDARWGRAMRPAAHRLMVIDDLANRGQDADLLLDQNLGRQDRDYADHLPAAARVLTGPAYALLRPGFAARRGPSLAQRAQRPLRQLLLSLGGVDAGNATGQVLQALRDCALPVGTRISVVMGPSAPWLDAVRRQAARMPWPTEVLLNPPDMARLMADSDLAIGGCGSTAWERCCLGLPSLVLVLADNQRAGALALARQGSVRLLPEIADAAPAEGPEHGTSSADMLAPGSRQRVDLALALQQALAALAEPPVLHAMQQAAAKVTDGGGAARVVAAMLACHG